MGKGKKKNQLMFWQLFLFLIIEEGHQEALPSTQNVSLEYYNECIIHVSLNTKSNIRFWFEYFLGQMSEYIYYAKRSLYHLFEINNFDKISKNKPNTALIIF